MQSKAITPHLHQFINSLLPSFSNSKKADQSTQINPPTSQTLTNLHKLQSILQQKKKAAETSLKLQEKLTRQNESSSAIISKDDIDSLQILKQQLKENEQVLKVATICQQIDSVLLNFQKIEGNNQILQYKSLIKRLSSKDTTLKELYSLISQFDDQINRIICERDKLHKKSYKADNKYHYRDSLPIDMEIQNNSQTVHNEISFQLLQIRNKYLKNLKSNCLSVTVKNFYAQTRKIDNQNISNDQLLDEALQHFHLPIKPNIKRKENTINSPILINIIIQALFTQYCYYCLSKKIELVLDQKEEDMQIKESRSNAKNYNFTEIWMEFRSPFFTKIWSSLFKSIQYIFINHATNYASFSEVNSGYQIDEPGWMFQYIQKAFIINFEYITKQLINILIGKDGQQPIIGSQTLEKQIQLDIEDERFLQELDEVISVYFLSYNIQELFLRCITYRLETDIINLIENGKIQCEGYVSSNSRHSLGNNKSKEHQSEQQKKQINFIFFNFFDELLGFQQQIESRFDTELTLIETTLDAFMNPSKYFKNPKLPPINILQYVLLYQDSWVEDKIFKEFYNINYSNITNLKNIESYNIVINFIQLFDRLYSKFRTVQKENLKVQIDEFYCEIILRLVRHIKSSFQRIYNYNGSGLDRFQILMGFKKVEEEFKGYFQGFLKTIPTFEAKIGEEYYSVIQQYSNIYALEELNSTHKKIYKQLTQLSPFFTNKQHKEPPKLQKWHKIYQDWQKKMQKIKKLTSNRPFSLVNSRTSMFTDNKLKNIFFVFLQSTQFCFEGYQIFMELFQSYLIYMYSIDNFKTIKMLVQMDKSTLKQYKRSHNNTISFLSGNQIQSLEKVVIK